MVQTFTEFTDAHEACQEGQTICSALRDGSPVYFLAPTTISDNDLREVAFEVRYGRAMSDGERQITAAVMEVKPEALSATLDDLAAE